MGSLAAKTILRAYGWWLTIRCKMGSSRSSRTQPMLEVPGRPKYVGKGSFVSGAWAAALGRKRVQQDQWTTGASAEKPPHDLEHDAHDHGNDHHRHDRHEHTCVLALDPDVSREPAEPIQQTGHVPQPGGDQCKTDEDQYDTRGKIHGIKRVELQGWEPDVVLA